MLLNNGDLEKIKYAKDEKQYIPRISDLSLIRFLQSFIISKIHSEDFNRYYYANIDPEVFDEFRISEYIPTNIRPASRDNKINPTPIYTTPPSHTSITEFKK